MGAVAWELQETVSRKSTTKHDSVTAIRRSKILSPIISVVSDPGVQLQPLNHAQNPTAPISLCYQSWASNLLSNPLNVTIRGLGLQNGCGALTKAKIGITNHSQPLGAQLRRA
jgi:hypothetical protein